jgi:molybdenum cofactor synthesis domain-containing protein
MRYGLSEEQIAEIKDFLARYPEVEKAVLFGSRAIGSWKPASDVDIALFGSQANAALGSVIKFDIEEDTYLPFFFDIVAYSKITNAALKAHIDSKGIVLYKRKERTHEEENSMAHTKPLSGKRYRVGIITASDKGARGEREDASGALIREMMSGAGYDVQSYCLLPDEKEALKAEMRRLADNALVDLVLTTGGTGFSPRDWTPEATTEIAERFVPGIAEAMRAAGMAITKRAMLSRAVSVIRGKTLIVNLPGSPKAVRENLEFIVGELPHALEILCGEGGECALP